MLRMGSYRCTGRILTNVNVKNIRQIQMCSVAPQLQMVGAIVDDVVDDMVDDMVDAMLNAVVDATVDARVGALVGVMVEELRKLKHVFCQKVQSLPEHGSSAIGSTLAISTG